MGLRVEMGWEMATGSDGDEYGAEGMAEVGDGSPSNSCSICKRNRATSAAYLQQNLESEASET